jgi:putative transposase
MPLLKASEIILSEKEKQMLTELAKSTHQPLHLKKRAEIILRANAGCSNNAIERDMGIGKKQVKCWRDRYSKNREQIALIEKETPKKLRSGIIEVLSDVQRSGCPPLFRDEQVAAIIAMACESPEKFDLPVSQWTPRLLQQKAIELGIVETISVRHVGRLLKKMNCSLIVPVAG